MDKFSDLKVFGFFFQSRNIAKLKSILSVNDLKTVVTTLITSGMDYWDCLYLGISQHLLARSQLVQNSAARLLTGTRNSILLFLPHFAAFYFNAELILKFFCIFSKVYMAWHWNIVLTSSALFLTPDLLNSLIKLLLVVLQSRLVYNEECAFAVAAPKLWDSVPLLIKCLLSTDRFKTQLQIYLLSLAFNCI